MNHLGRQYSAANAWNVNTNNANVNNNTKTNTNRVRAVSELESKNPSALSLLYQDLIQSYYVCRRRKTTKDNMIAFEIGWQRKVLKMAREMNQRVFRFGKCITFVRTNPVPREVFASLFRTRTMQTWATLRLNPILEEVLDNGMMSNRIGRGTSGAVKLAHEYGLKYRDGWVVGFDLRGFFMSIDKRIANAKWQALIDERYTGWDKDILKAFVNASMKHCPQKDCIFVGRPELRELITPERSLIGQDAYHGLVIGDQISQMTALLMLLDAVIWLHEHNVEAVVEYVDDFLAFTMNIEDLKKIWPEFRAYLKEHLGLTLHSRKGSMQQAWKGWHFVGSKAKPGVEFASDRSVRSFNKAVDEICSKHPENGLGRMNSHLGILSQYATMKLRVNAVSRFLNANRGEYYGKGRIPVIKKRNLVSDRTRFCQYIRNQRNRFRIWGTVHSAA